MRAVKIAGRILSGIVTAILVLVLACNVYTIVARSVFGKPQPTVFGHSVAVVLSGSMLDALNVNDMVLTQRQETYEVGDVITFVNDAGTGTVTHRIIEIKPEGYLTKGDANPTPDPKPIPQERIVGQVVLVIPKVGYAIEYLNSPLGLMLVTLAGAAIIYLPALIGDRNTDRAEEKHEGKEETEG